MNSIQKESSNFPKIIFKSIKDSENSYNNSKFCSICNKNFSNYSNLRNHIMTFHEKNRPFKCNFPNCNKSYSIKSRLNLHLLTHTGKKKFHM